MDVKTTFLHGDLEEQIYMEQPDRFTQPGHEHLVCKLKKSLYMAVAEAAKEALWLSGLSKELGVEQGGVQLHCDRQSAIYLAKN
ncbi:UNVERIFIED_CONTAM: Retrovirus-related Pol polyprotein from transposon TNT 1-94 [Sesamum radiatum]|uniref:Retrovirus-related Pol polyprotein from transposon TNT 1-94 n=1 Tax=Sesamum radiatum TaxID=300843 RepID=A0AAW2M426_SESRA